MINLKLTIGVLLGSLLVVVLVVVGLSRLSGDGGVAKISDDLVTGARLVSKNGQEKVLVVEFSDVQCPACKTAEPIGKELRTMAGVTFVYRHYPLTTVHKNSLFGARSVEAATKLGKGWDMLEVMFDKQSEWESLDGDKLDRAVIGYATGLGMVESDFVAKQKSEDVASAVNEDINLGNRIRLSGTPTFYIDGEMVASNLVLSKVKEKLKTR